MFCVLVYALLDKIPRWTFFEWANSINLPGLVNIELSKKMNQLLYFSFDRIQLNNFSDTHR